jgi:molybdopterin synthase catalytic subunit
MPEIRTAVTDEPLDLAAAIAQVSAPECGGIGVFIGTVRSSAAAAARSDVRALEYEAHPSLAPQRLDAIARAAGERWDVRRVVLEHRTGRCEVGEPTVVVACSAPHRADALDACRWMIDELKREVPIWKREVYEDGSAWVGAGP